MTSYDVVHVYYDAVMLWEAFKQLLLRLSFGGTPGRLQQKMVVDLQPRRDVLQRESSYRYILTSRPSHPACQSSLLLPMRNKLLACRFLTIEGCEDTLLAAEVVCEVTKDPSEPGFFLLATRVACYSSRNRLQP